MLLFKLCNCQELIAKDSAGLIVEVKEKYGGINYDTCTIVMKYDGDFITVHRNGTTSRYPACFHSIKIYKRKRRHDEM